MIFSRYKRFRPFTRQEAWALFRLAALAEAVGWTMLIIGIACKSLPVGWHEVPVQLAGRIHGVLFLAYIMAVLLLSPSLGWSLPRTFIAGLFSVPPYGSLIYEQWSVHYKDWQHLKVLRNLLRYRQLAKIT